MATPYLRVRFTGDLPGGEVWSVNPAFALIPAGPAASDGQLVAWAENIAALNAGNVLPDAARAILSDAGGLLSIRCEYFGTDGKLERAYELALPARKAGTGSATSPITTAVCVSLRTAILGRSSRGRLFWPALKCPLNSGTLRMDPTLTSAIAEDTADWLVAVADAYSTGGILTPVVASPTKGVVNAITQVRVGNVPDNLRQRKDSLEEAYVVAAL